MKVTDTKQINPLTSGKPAEPIRAAGRERGEASDRVSTEETARITAAIARASTAAGAARSTKLQAIENAVRQGTYRPDPQRIAQQILDEAELAARLQAIFSK